MEQHVTLQEIDQHLDRFIQKVAEGEEIIITRHGLPIARLLPMAKTRQLTESQQAAWNRTLARMQKGFHMGGKLFSRDEVYEH